MIRAAAKETILEMIRNTKVQDILVTLRYLPKLQATL